MILKICSFEVKELSIIIPKNLVLVILKILLLL
jgi:hypothetical protein